MKIKIIGTDMPELQNLVERTKKAVAELGVKAEIETVTDMMEMNKYTISLPGLVLNEKVIHGGSPVPDTAEIKEMISSQIS